MKAKTSPHGNMAEHSMAAKVRAVLVDVWTDAVVAVAGWLVLLALALAFLALSAVTKQLPRPLPGERQPSQILSPRSQDIASRQHDAGREIRR